MYMIINKNGTIYAKKPNGERIGLFGFGMSRFEAPDAMVFLFYTLADAQALRATLCTSWQDAEIVQCCTGDK